MEHALRQSVDEGRSGKADSSSSSSTKNKKKVDDDEIITVICGVLVGIGVLIYYVILCFTVFDTSKETEKYHMEQAKLKKQRRDREEARAAKRVLAENKPQIPSAFSQPVRRRVKDSDKA